MTHDVKEDIFKSTKEGVKKLVDESKASVSRIHTEAIPKCDTFALSYLLGDTAEARGAAASLVKLFPDDLDIKFIWKEAVDAHSLAFKGRDKFATECECKKKM